MQNSKLSFFTLSARTIATATLLTVGLAGFASRAGAGQAPPPPEAQQPDTAHHSRMSAVRHWFQVGVASWYGPHFQGRETANGETYNMHELTCAHRTLPLGTWLRVTNLHNHKFVFVRVNDRGPMVDGRIVDLSYAAAQAVGIDGLGKVRLDKVTPAEPVLEQQLVSQLSRPEFAEISLLR